MQDGRKAVWSIPYVSVAFFPSLKHYFIAYRSSKVSPRPDCIFEIRQLRQSGFSRVYSNCCCSCSFEREMIKISLSSHKMYSNNILNFQESIRTKLLFACYNTLTFGAVPPGFAYFGRTLFIAWCLRRSIKGMPTRSRIFFTCHACLDSCAGPTIKWSCATLWYGELSNKSPHRSVVSNMLDCDVVVRKFELQIPWLISLSD